MRSIAAHGLADAARCAVAIRHAFAVAAFGVALSACGGGSGGDSGTGNAPPPPPPPPVDTTAPAVSALTASAGFQEATVSWTTDEPSDSQVEYGPTAAYGSATTVATPLVTSHTLTLSGLSAATTYHYRVRSQDAAGNLATSADLTFTTTAIPDTTAPTLSNIVAMPTVQAATISWTTNEPADSQVEYGTTTAYGSSSALAAALVTSHTVTLSGLTASTSYHYRVKSRDAAGNLATSTDASFSTSTPPDTTAPVVSISSPTSGATVSASVSIAATATDNVGVTGVQFLVDGTAVGSEDTTNPYSASWDTTTVADGSHALTAIARDAAGNQTTSATVNVTVSNVAPPPPGVAITVGQIVIDRPTLETVGVSLPITAGDTNYNASVAVRYRRVGDSTWKDALPLLRVRPEDLSWEDPSPFAVDEQFAGSVFDLTPDTDYDVELSVHDPDGGDVTQTATVHTRPVPPANPATPNTVSVSTLSELNTALANAAPGDVITLADGTYNGAIRITHSGTAQNPIFIRGTSRDGTILNASGATYGIDVVGDYVTVENLTIKSSSWGMHLESAQNLVARRLHLMDVSYGMDGRDGAGLDYYICDNLLEGKVMWPTTDSSVWDLEGIVLVGQGHVVCYNTLSGFGDALGLSHPTDIPNRAIDFYGNDVLWTGDNGIELDFSERNVRAFRNRFSNGGNHSISFQPIWGGPAYAIRNVIYNSIYAPYKLNNEPTGIYLLHNTAVRPGLAWEQLGYTATNFVFRNNLFIGTTDGANVTTDISLADIDYDGWLPDGQFRFTALWTSFADLQASSPYEHHGRLLNGLPFEAAITIPASPTTPVTPLDARLKADTNALDAGTPLPNINDGWLGTAPDLGAIERGSTTPTYGVRP